MHLHIVLHASGHNGLKGCAHCHQATGESACIIAFSPVQLEGLVCNVQSRVHAVNPRPAARIVAVARDLGNHQPSPSRPNTPVSPRGTALYGDPRSSIAGLAPGVTQILERPHGSRGRVQAGHKTRFMPKPAKRDPTAATVSTPRLVAVPRSSGDVVQAAQSAGGAPASEPRAFRRLRSRGRAVAPEPEVFVGSRYPHGEASPETARGPRMSASSTDTRKIQAGMHMARPRSGARAPGMMKRATSRSTAVAPEPT